VIFGKVVVDLGLLQRRDDTRSGGGGHDGHWVPLALQPLESLRHTVAHGGLGPQLGDDGVDLAGDVSVNLLGGHGEAMLFLQADHHAAEVLANKGLQKLMHSVALGDLVVLEDLIGEVGAGLEGQLLREDESVVAVEKDVLDLYRGPLLAVDLSRVGEARR
jgi:hypothetical protein